MWPRARGGTMAPLSGGPRAGSWCQLSPGSCGWLACGRGDIPAGGCRLSPPCGGTPPAPPFLKAAPPPLCIAGAAAANFLPRPLPHLGRIWAGAGRGGVAGGVGGSGGPGLRGAGREPRGGGMKEVVAWVTAPEPGPLPRAADHAQDGAGSGGPGAHGGLGCPPSLEPGPAAGNCREIPPAAAGGGCWGRDPLTLGQG